MRAEGVAELQVRKLGDVKQLQLGSESTITIGRSSENAVVLSDRTVSRRHCVIEILSDAVRLRDLESRYGTKVNGETIDEAELHDGDRVRVGPYELVVTGIAAAPTDADASAGEPAGIPIAEDETTTDADRGGDELTLDMDEQAAGAAELEQREAELAGKQETLRKDRAKLRRERAKLKKQRQQLADERDQLEADRAALEKDALLGKADRSADDDQAELDRQREALAAERDQLEADRKALQDQQQALEQQQGALTERADRVQQREEDLATREQQLESRGAELDDQAQQLEAQQSERDEQTREALEQRQQLAEQLEDAQRKLDDATTSLSEKADAVAALESELAELRRDRDELINSADTERAELTERLATVESEAESLRQQANRVGGELEQKSAQLEDAMKQTLELQQRIDELAHAHGQSARRLDRIDSAMRRLHEPTELLGVAARRLATAQQRVTELEARWVRCDQQFNAAAQNAQQQQAERALTERDRVAAALEEANAARDQAAGELRAAAEEAVRLVRAVPTVDDADAGAPTDSPHPARRKWFARKR